MTRLTGPLIRNRFLPLRSAAELHRTGGAAAVMTDSMDRRALLRLGLAGLAAPALLGTDSATRSLPPGAVPRFAVDLPLPRVARATRVGGVDTYRMTQRPASVQVLPPGLPPTPLWTYDGSFPGPTIHAERGRPAAVRQRNALPEDVSTHLHGMASRPEDDGQPGLPVRPGGERVYHYPNAQPGATLWYHDHADMATSPHVYRGLAGLYLLHDPAEDRLGLPAGDQDVPLVLQDRTFDRDGRLVFDDHAHTDVLGDVALVNGAAWPRLAVQRRRYRFRVLVASNSRPYLLGLSDGRPFTVVASDGGLLPRPVRTAGLLAVMAERYDIVVDFSDLPAGRSVSLVNQLETGRLHELLRFDVGRLRGRDESRVPAELAEPPRLATATTPVDRVWHFAHGPTGFVINGRPFDGDRVDARPRLGSTEVWELRTQGLGFFHPVHPHLVRFQVLSRDGRPPAAYERGWKDTVLVGERSVVRIAARFAPHTGRYVLHCHNLVHEDHAMMTQFEVVAA